MRLIPLTRIDNCKVTSDEIRALYAPPAPRDYTAEALDWFDRIDRRIKVAVLAGAYLFAVWCGCTPG